ncbi:helix-turn-helix domain-containing protein [Antrihabitans spumae]|uniref:Helix-turn-helix domain-containing protein n=1 Tax=Antrihabitans spumae TaxID=3373370 RepID=A0ABW7KDK1_9NOCA
MVTRAWWSETSRHRTEDRRATPPVDLRRQSKIETVVRGQKSLRSIADRLGRAPSTVKREIGVNG